ncbi:Inner centromere protein, partial [Mesitornis unicolor]
IKNFIKRSTPTRPDVKSGLLSLQEKERQRLESLRKKQEAEEQRRKKVEEEKKRRQAEMKQKALQARERVEQMEEEKKKRMEQKILQSDEKVRLSQVREEKVAEERSKKKLSKKHGEADAQKQKALKVGFLFLLLQEEDEFEQQEPLQKRREDEVKERGKRVLELKNLMEHQQVEQVKERAYKQRGKEKDTQPRLDLAALTEKSIKVGSCGLGTPSLLTWRGVGLVVSVPWQGQLYCQAGRSASHSNQCCLWFQKSVSTSCLGPLKGAKESRSPKVNENNYGMDLNTDDSTDDENEPRKPVPAWADGSQLNQAIIHQYYHPMDIDQIFGQIPSPKLEDIFGKSKPRYYKRTSSAVWHSPP